MLAWVGSQLRLGRYASSAAALGASALVVACALDMGGLMEGGDADGGSMEASVPDATLDGSGDGGGVDSARGDDAAGADSAAADSTFMEPDTGTGPGVDSGTDDASGTDGCVAKGPEICTDGIDNDCNGATDCEDPACTAQGYGCVDPPPGGWSFVAFAPTAPSSQSACPTSLHTTAVDVDPIDTPATCSCTCGVGAAPTCTGMVTSKFGTNSTACTMAGASAPADGSCSMVPVTVGTDMQVGNPAGSGGSCVPDAGISAPPPGSTRGEICSGENKFGAGCSAGQVCALAPAPFGACIAKNGQVACPTSSYTTVHYAGQLNDTRSCTNCQCGGSPMCALTWSFYNSPKCNANAALVLTPDGTCQPTGTFGGAYTSNMLVGSATGATCAPPAMQPTPTGQVSLNAEQTVCCE